MPYVVINGKRTYLPDKTSIDNIRRLGGIPSNHIVIQKTREGNFPLLGGSVEVKEGQRFDQAPPRDKG